MLVLACPKSSWTYFGWTPWLKSSVAQVCLRSWKRTGGNLARFNSAAKGC